MSSEEEPNHHTPDSGAKVCRTARTVRTQKWLLLVSTREVGGTKEKRGISLDAKEGVKAEIAVDREANGLERFKIVMLVEEREP